MRNKTVRRMTLDSIFIAIITMLTFIPQTGYISFGPLSFTTIHVIVLLGAMLLGWKEGALFGFVFGLTSLIKAVTMPGGPLDPFFINPAVSILPRFIFGLLAGITYDLIKKINNPQTVYVSFCIVTPVLTLIHSFLTLSMLWACHGSEIITIDGFQGFDYGIVLGTIITWNGLMECGLSFIISPNLALPLFNALRKDINSPFMNYRREYKCTEADKLTKKYRKDMVKTLKELVGINSVYDETTKDEENPFGKGVSNALNYITEMARKDGFVATNYGNKIVEIFAGDGEKNITIMAHADVVPVTGNKKRSMFDMYRHNFAFYGRGTSDDKGPFLASYYAVKALRDNDLLHGFKVRILVGGNEESGSAGMKYYFEELKKEQPTYGFSPDSDFPLTYAEKGIFNFDINHKVDLKDVISIEGGVASNAVIDNCVLKSKNKSLIDDLKGLIKDSSVSEEDGVYSIAVRGITAHGSMPEKGVNAALILLQNLAKIEKIDSFSTLIDKITPTDASGLNAGGHSVDMGYNTLNFGLVTYKDGLLNMTMNFRYVDNLDVNVLKKNIADSLSDSEVIFGEVSELLFYPKDTPLIKTLMKSYQDETGDFESEPLAIGGGTYAKEADNVVAFGMQFPGYDTKMHESGEFLPVACLYKGLSIYYRAIIDLGELIKSEN